MSIRFPFFYGWALVGLGFVTLAIVYGLRFAFSAFFVAILDEFGWGRAETSLIFSLNVLVYGLCVPFAGALLDRFGPRVTLPLGVAVVCGATAAASLATELWHFYLLIGVVAALGTALSGFINFAVMITSWFVKRRGTALGFTLAGNGVSFLVVTLAQTLINGLGWRSAYLVLGLGLGAVLLPLAVLLPRSRPESMGLRPDGDPALPLPAALPGAPALKSAESDPTLGEAVRDYRYWCLFLANMLIWGFGFNLIVAHQLAYAKDGGVDPILMATVVAIYGFANIGGNMAGFLSDRIGREWAYTLGTAAGMVAVLCLLAGGSPETAWLLFIYGPLYGVAMGIISPTQTAATADLFGGRHFGKIQGLIVTGFGIGGSIGPWLGGFIYDTRESYFLAVLVSLTAIVGAGVMMWLAAPRRGRTPRPAGLQGATSPRGSGT
ncbi:MAG: MFS transporter [Chloroflexi bacterium]|nr:MFS transporter [Chloroflexota bacterium]